MICIAYVSREMPLPDIVSAVYTTSQIKVNHPLTIVRNVNPHSESDPKVVHFDFGSKNWSVEKLLRYSYPVVIDFEITSKADLDVFKEYAPRISSIGISVCTRYVSDEYKEDVLKILEHDDILFYLPEVHRRYLTNDKLSDTVCMVLDLMYPYDIVLSYRCPFKRTEASIEDILTQTCNKCIHFDPYEVAYYLEQGL